MSIPQRQYSTGLQFLDRRINGGLTAGTLLAITAPPQSQSEAFLREFIQTHHTHYVSTINPADEVEAWAQADGRTPPNLTVVRKTPTELLAESESMTSQISPESFVIVDRVNGVEEAARSEYLHFLDSLKSALRRTDSVGVLHYPEDTPTPELRTLTLARADQVWQIEMLSLSREIKTRLLVTKSRYGRALREPVDIILTDRVTVDTSRKIS